MQVQTPCTPINRSPGSLHAGERTSSRFRSHVFRRSYCVPSNMERPKGLPIRKDVFAQLPPWTRTILELVAEGPRSSAHVRLEEWASRGESRLCICSGRRLEMGGTTQIPSPKSRSEAAP